MKIIRNTKEIKNSGYHPGNISIGDTNIKRDDPINEITVKRDNKVILYDANDEPLIRKIGFK